MSFTIEGSRGILHTSSCFGDFRVSLVDSIRARVTRAEDMTNITALKILKEIAFQSSLLSLALSPTAIVLLGLTAPVIMLSTLVFSSFTSALLALSAIVTVVAAGLFITHILDETVGSQDLSKLSRSYDTQAREAKEYIRTIESRVEETGFTLKYKASSHSYYSY